MTPSQPNEEMIVRVLADGRIVIDGSGLAPSRLRELRDTLQEVLGPARIYDEERREYPDAVRIWGGGVEAGEEKATDSSRQRQGGGPD